MDKNNNMYGQDRNKEGMQNESADYRKNQVKSNIGSQSGDRKQDGCDKQQQNGSEWKQQGDAAKQAMGGKMNEQAGSDKYGVGNERQQPGKQGYGSQTTQGTPGMGGTGKQSGIADTDKTDAQKKQNTPGGSY